MRRRNTTGNTGTDVSFRKTTGTFNAKQGDELNKLLFSKPKQSKVAKPQNKTGVANEMQDFGNYVRSVASSTQLESTTELPPKTALPAVVLLTAIYSSMKQLGDFKAGKYMNQNWTNAVGRPNTVYGSGTASTYPMANVTANPVTETGQNNEQTTRRFETTVAGDTNSTITRKRSRRDFNFELTEGCTTLTYRAHWPLYSEAANVVHQDEYEDGFDERTYNIATTTDVKTLKAPKQSCLDIPGCASDACTYEGGFGERNRENGTIFLTLQNMIEKEIKQYYTSRYQRCLTKDDDDNVGAITSLTDELFHQIVNIIKPQTVDPFSNFVKPVVKWFADAIIHAELMLDNSLKDRIDLGNLAKIVVSSSLERDPTKLLNFNELKIKNSLVFPGIAFRNDKIQCYIDGAWRDLQSDKDYNCLVRYGSEKRRIWYSAAHERWFQSRDCTKAMPVTLKGRKVYACKVGRTYGYYCDNIIDLEVYRIIGGSLGDIYDTDYIITKSAKLIPLSHFKNPRQKVESSEWQAANSYPGELWVNSKGIKEENFRDDIYIVDKRAPEEILKNGFGHTQEFDRVASMIDGEAVIASSTYRGALRRLYNKEGDYHIYRLKNNNLKGASVARNIFENPLMVQFLLRTRRVSVASSVVDWEFDTQGATHFDEIHVHAEDLAKSERNGHSDPEKVKSDVEKLELGKWVYYS